MQWVKSTLVPDMCTEVCKDAQRFCMVNLSHDLLQFDEPEQVIWILLTTLHEMSGSRKWRGALACVLWASVVGCFLTTETTRNPPRSVKLRGLPPGVDVGKTNSFWVAVQKAASRNKTDAQTYLEGIVALADSHMNSSKVVDRDAAIQALIRSMEKTGLLTLVLGGKNKVLLLRGHEKQTGSKFAGCVGTSCQRDLEEDDHSSKVQTIHSCTFGDFFCSCSGFSRLRSCSGSHLQFCEGCV